VHLVGFTVEIYYDARSYKRQMRLISIAFEPTASGWLKVHQYAEVPE